MRSKVWLKTILVAVLVAGLGLVLSAMASPGILGPDEINKEEWDLLGKINIHRSNNGLPAVALSKILSNCAAKWSRHMASVDVLHHPYQQPTNDPNWWKNCVTGQGYPWQYPYVADILYGGVAFAGETAKGAIDTWKGSPPHNDVILERGAWTMADWKAVGIGQAYNSSTHKWFWTAVFGERLPTGDKIGSPHDDVNPSVSITNPPDGSTVSGTVTVEASASDASGMAFVEFYLNPGWPSQNCKDKWTTLKGTAYPPSYTHTWNTAAHPAGSSVTWGAKAYDKKGNTKCTTVTVTTGLGELKTSKPVYALAEPVTFAFTNRGTMTITLRNSAPWVIKDSAGNVIYAPIALQVITEVLPGASKTWSWDQKDNAGKQVPAGTYTVELETMNAGTYAATFEIRNTPPNRPSRPKGPTSGNNRQHLTYSTSATDPDGDQIYYTFNWGDGTTSRVPSTGYVNSGKEVSASHRWHTAGTYQIFVTATDIHGATSGASSPLTVNIYGITAPPNVVQNPGFEDWPTGAPLPTYWEVGVKHEENDAPGDPQAIRQTTDAHSGNYAVQLGAEAPAPGEGYAIISQDILNQITPGKTYEFSLWVKGWNPAGLLSARAYVWWLDAAGNYLYPPTDPRSRIVINIPASTTYQLLKASGEAPSGAVSARIQIGKYSWGFIRVDDVSLTPK
jgi:uncharacterized protein YkwD